MLHTGYWTDYSQFVYSKTAIPTIDQVERFLGMKCLSEDSPWVEHAWTWSQELLGQVSKEEFSVWLMRLFLAVALPAISGYNHPMRENRPYTMAMFVRCCEFCIEWLGYPSHWVSTVLDDLLSHTASKPLKTKAQVPEKSPNVFRRESNTRSYDLTSFLLDLRTQLTLHLQGKQNKLLPLETLSLTTEPVRVYELEVGLNLKFAQLEDMGLPFIGCLGLVLELTKPSKADIEDDPLSMMMKMMQGLSSKKDTIRDAVLSQGSKKFHLLSCIEWSPDNNVRFYMSEKEFDELGSYYASVFRTDGWFRLGTAVQLHNAKLIR